MTARIKIDQVGLPAGVAGRARTDGLDTGALVTLEDVDGAGDSTFHLMWGPTDDTTAEASLAATVDPDVWTFSPDAGCYGSYLIELRVDGVPIERRVFGIRTPANGLLIPALNERASRHASWDNEGATQIDLSENNATDFNDADLNALPYAGYWRSLCELYRAFENGLNFPSNLVVAGAQSITTSTNFTQRAGGDLLLNGASGTALESCAAPSSAIATGDVCVNADSGLALTTGSQRTAVGGNIDMLTAGDLIANALSGVNICADAAAAVSSVGTGVIALNAPTNGVAITCGLAEENLVGGGDFKVNTSSGIRLHSGAVKQTTATGLQLSTDFDLEIDVEDDALINFLGGFAIACGGLTNPGPIDGRVIWHLTNGFVMSSDGSAGGGGGILIEAAAAVSSTPPADGIIQLNASVVAARLTGAPFLQIAEASASTPSNSAGFGMVWVQDTAPCELRYTDDVNADWNLNVHGCAGMSAITTRTNSTTVLNGATFNVPASVWRAGTTFRFSGMLRYARGATATAANLTAGISCAGNSVADSGAQATSVANGYVGTAWVEGYITCITTGSSGTAIAAVRVHHTIPSTTLVTSGPNTISTFTLNTTQANDIDLFSVFSAAVANLEMTWQAATITKVR